MLSRVADSLYWMSRYLERAEHMTRLIAVNMTNLVEQDKAAASDTWTRILAGSFLPVPAAAPFDPKATCRDVIFDKKNGMSVFACINYARDNARQIREHISSEMWEQLNRLFLQLRSADFDAVWAGEPVAYFNSIIDDLFLFHGIASNTMSHGEGWHFIQLGRFMERANLLSRLLDLYFSAKTQDPLGIKSPPDYAQWVGLLKMCSAFEAYCRVYTASVQPQRVAEFLILDADFPRSIRFAIDRIEEQLGRIAPKGLEAEKLKCQRIAGKVRARLDYSEVHEIIGETVHGFLDDVQQQLDRIHGAVYESFIDYPLDAHLPS